MMIRCRCMQANNGQSDLLEFEEEKEEKEEDEEDLRRSVSAVNR